MPWYSSVAQFASDALGPRPSREPINGDAHESAYNGNRSAFFQGEAETQSPGTMLMNGSAFPFPRPAWAPSAADRVYQAFDASQPVDQPQDLRGRAKEVARLLSGVLHRRNHGIVSGPRGSGKTSLVRVFGQYADREGIVVLYAACDGGTTFGELMRGYLEQIPPSSIDADEVDLFDQRVLSFGLESSPHQATSILAQIKYSQVVIVLDEFDRVHDPILQAKIASLLKLISDARLPVRFVLVGGNNAFVDVVREHPSLTRHVTRVSTAPLAREAVFELLDNCAERCGMRFSREGQELLELVSCGSPYHARLFGMHSALAALRRGDTTISEQDALDGIAEGTDEWASLNREDAGRFRAICQGEFGDPAQYVDFAGRFAMSNEEQPWAASLSNGGGGGEILEAFGPAIDDSHSPPSFRDATAPQYLIAMQQVMARSSRQQKGSARA
jgi:hypothetical protein